MRARVVLVVVRAARAGGSEAGWGGLEAIAPVGGAARGAARGCEACGCRCAHPKCTATAAARDRLARGDLVPGRQAPSSLAPPTEPLSMQTRHCLASGDAEALPVSGAAFDFPWCRSGTVVAGGGVPTEL